MGIAEGETGAGSTSEPLPEGRTSGSISSRLSGEGRRRRERRHTGVLLALEALPLGLGGLVVSEQPRVLLAEPEKPQRLGDGLAVDGFAAAHFLGLAVGDLGQLLCPLVAEPTEDDVGVRVARTPGLQMRSQLALVSDVAVGDQVSDFGGDVAVVVSCQDALTLHVHTSDLSDPYDSTPVTITGACHKS